MYQIMAIHICASREKNSSTELLPLHIYTLLEQKYRVSCKASIIYEVRKIFFGNFEGICKGMVSSSMSVNVYSHSYTIRRSLLL
jgi:hypothetical protein